MRFIDGDVVTIDSSGTLRRALSCCSRMPLELDADEPVEEEGGDSAGEPEHCSLEIVVSPSRLGDRDGTGTR